MSISIKETVGMEGLCPVLEEQTTIDVTYRKHSVLGDPHSYAIVCGLNCPNIEECQDPSECPVALQRTYW